MQNTTTKAVEMVRRIRDAHYEQLRGKSPEEWIAFYRAKAGLWQAEIAAQRQKTGRRATARIAEVVSYGGEGI